MPAARISVFIFRVFIFRMFGIGLGLLLPLALLNAQATSSLHGTITDAQGAVIPDAVVKLGNAATGFSRQVNTDQVGVYQFPQMAPGEYSITVQKPGFATASRDKLQLQVNVAAALDLQMEVSAAGDVV